jgi:hypothetical protein
VILAYELLKENIPFKQMAMEAVMLDIRPTMIVEE